MPRVARKQSQTGIFHVMLRAVNQQQIFEDEEDYERFLAVLAECKQVSGFALYGYCLMGNHVHLLLRVRKEPLDTIFRHIGSRFVYWYNLKYQRVGHLFQDRFRSEAVEDDRYFLTVLRYILCNPIKAGLEETHGVYPWSSWAAYFGRNDPLTDVDFALLLAGGQEALHRFVTAQNEDKVMDLAPPRRPALTDQAALAVMQKRTHCADPVAFQQLPRHQRDRYLVALSKERLSLRQLSRLTGVSKTTIERVLMQYES